MAGYLRSSALFIGAYLVSVGALMWTNTVILCLGDPKFGGGCGGFTLYYYVWVVFFAPLVVVALVLVRPKKTVGADRLRNLLLLIYLALIASALEVSFINDASVLILAVEWLILGIVFRLLRSWGASHNLGVDKNRH